RSGVPPEVVGFMRLPGLGPKTAARIWRELGVTTLEELKAAAEAERLRTLPGLGAKSEEKILKALAFRVENPDAGRRLLGDGLPESFGNLLQHFTGSKEHNVAMREDAVRRGLSISEYGVTTVETGEVFKTEDEDALYAFLGYQPIPPELREHGGELEAAKRGE